MLFGGALQGSSGAIFHNESSGGQTITANGSVTGTAGAGIYAQNGSLATGITINTAVGTTVSGTVVGIGADNNGVGAISITANGNVSGGTVQGIRATNAGGATTVKAYGDVNSTNTHGIYIYGETTSAGDITVMTGESTYGVTRDTSGIVIRGDGTTGDVIVNAQGDVTGNGGFGILANNSNGDNVTITTGAYATIAGTTSNGINANLGNGTGTLSITANGRVYGDNNAIYARNGSGAYLNITTHARVAGGNHGIHGENYSGAMTIIANGNVSGDDNAGIFAQNSGNGLSVTTGAGSLVEGYDFGIRARNAGSGATTVIANGDVTGGGDGVYAANTATGSNVIVTAGPGSDVTGNYRGVTASTTAAAR